MTQLGENLIRLTTIAAGSRAGLRQLAETTDRMRQMTGACVTLPETGQLHDQTGQTPINSVKYQFLKVSC